MNTLPEFPLLLEKFFTDRLMHQRRASPHTVASYRDTFWLLLKFAQDTLKKGPSQLLIEELTAPFIGMFLEYLENKRGNSVHTRNTRLAASRNCSSLKRKRVSPHTLRHTTAMELLQHGVDLAVIALWLGHESVETTQMCAHVDLKIKEKILAKTTPVGMRPGRYRPKDHLLAFLKSL
jgi:site-specific recombinase XerD